MARGRPLVPLMLGDRERGTLESWTRRRTAAHAFAQREDIVRPCAAGKANLRSSDAREERAKHHAEERASEDAGERQEPGPERDHVRSSLSHSPA
jgi:hypothetical protein